MIPMKKNFNNKTMNRINELYSEQGFKKTLITILDFIFDQFISIGYGYKLNLNELNYHPSVEGFNFKSISIKNLNDIFNNPSKEISMEEYQELLNKLKNPQYNGFIIQKQNDICGYFFLGYKKNEPNIKSDTINQKYNGYICNDYIFKKYRGKKLQQFAYHERLEILKSKNYKTATCLIHRNNYPSIATTKKFGFKKYITCYYFRFGPWMKTKIKYKLK